jgi:uncharacterized membrane protein
MMRKKINTSFLLAAAVFCLIYCLIALPNHYLFRTATLDLGLYTHNMFDYLHFRFADTAIFQEVSMNQLADHFDIYLMLFSPLLLVFGTYSLLIIQIAALLFGGFGIYKLSLLYSNNKKHALLFAVFLWSFFGVFSAVSFDYHSNVVAAMLVPWFLYFFKKEQYWQAWLFLILILIAKENMALWMFFVLSGLLWEYRKQKKALLHLSFLSIFSIFYFILIVFVLMPSMSSDNTYPHFNYSYFGDSPLAVIQSFFRQPLSFLQLLFSNHLLHPEANFVKGELLVFLLLSGGFLLFFKIQYLWMIIPLVLQKFMHDNFMMWGVGFHYNIEFGIIITLALISSVHSIKKTKWKNILLYSSLVLCIAVSFRSMDYTYGYNDKKRVRFYQKKHYQKDYNVKEVHAALKNIPKKAVVSAIAVYTPHLALRDKLYSFPIIKDAEYIVFSKKESVFGYSQEYYIQLTDSLLNDNNWIKEQTINDFYILKKN